MNKSSNLVFNNMSRIGNDSCDISQKNIQNTAHSNWTLTNFFSSDCNMKKGIDLALNAPAINFKGSHQVGVGGCNIDDNSNLKFEPLSRESCRYSLHERPFSTVPFLGRGAINADIESKMQQGEGQVNRKSMNNVTEKSHIPHRHTPMVPSLAKTVNNPVYYVEGVADENWVRGGVASRDLTRDTEYYSK